MYEAYVFLLITSFLEISSHGLIINTTSGPIQSTDSLSKDAEAFLGIPYAEPPTGKLRFSKPIPRKPWEMIYNASHLPPPCAQYSLGPYYFMPDVTDMSEDCLYLNVWIPKTEPIHGSRPVIVYIHHGGFSTGSSNMKVFDGSHLASKGDLMVVTINYRLGVFGYFLAYTEEANGNMGMYDQIMAVKWVKDNAKHFKGDPENIVLMGTSAGAFSISAHMVSPLSKNLFKKAILISGSAVHPAFLDDNAKLFRNSEVVSGLVGCTNETITLKDNPQSVVNCLKKKPVGDLLAAELILLKAYPFNFYPRVNDDFLPKDTLALLRDGQIRKDVNVMIGVNNDEGAIMIILGLGDYFGRYGENSLQNVNKHRAAALIRGVLMIAGQPKPSEVINFYLKHVKYQTSVGYTKMLANLIGDFAITCNTVFFADIVSLKGNSVYFYKLGFRAASTPTAEWMGTTHLDEVQYVFGNPYHRNFTEEEEELSQRIISRWAAFAKSGNPNVPGHVPWLRYSYHNPVYLYFGQEEESIRLKPDDRCEFWRERFNSTIDSDLIRFLRNSGI